jgi:hypothetical protein
MILFILNSVTGKTSLEWHISTFLGPGIEGSWSLRGVREFSKEDVHVLHFDWGITWIYIFQSSFHYILKYKSYLGKFDFNFFWEEEDILKEIIRNKLSEM